MLYKRWVQKYLRTHKTSGTVVGLFPILFHFILFCRDVSYLFSTSFVARMYYDELHAFPNLIFAALCEVAISIIILQMKRLVFIEVGEFTRDK